MIIDGKILSQEVKEKVKIKAKDFENTYGRKIGLAVIIVGDRPDSQTYVKNKVKACEQYGIQSFQYNLDESIKQERLESLIKVLNDSYEVDGILVQMPLPKHIDENKIINIISREKDVDGFRKDSNCIPCTPKGILYMLEKAYAQETLSGKTVLVIGRSDVVGKPIAKLLLDKNCNIMQAHSKTPSHVLHKMFSFADIVISAAGKVDIISEYDAEQYWKDNRHDFYGDFANKKDRVIIDVGINRLSNDTKINGDFSEQFKARFSNKYTPVPGGVGPMTIAMLLDNTVELAYKNKENNK